MADYLTLTKPLNLPFKKPQRKLFQKSIKILNKNLNRELNLKLIKLFKLMLLHHNVGCFASTVMCIRCTFLISSILCQQQQQKRSPHKTSRAHPPASPLRLFADGKTSFFFVHVRQCDYAQFYGEKIFLLVTGEKALGGAAVMAQSNGKVFNVAVCGGYCKINSTRLQQHLEAIFLSEISS